MIISCLYSIFGSLLFLISVVLLITVVFQYNLRVKYNVFSVKFLVDVIISTSLIVAGALDDRRDEVQCGTVLVISTTIPLLQVLFLLCEVIDWILAVFFPVYFHSSSLLFRMLPFIIGCIFCVIVLTVVLIIDVTTENTSCLSSPTDMAVLFTYDISLACATVCVVALLVLLARKLNSSLYKPVLFHFTSALLLLEIPLMVVVSLKYTSHDLSAVRAAHASNVFVAIHAILHSVFFIYNHEDYRQGIRSTFIKFCALTTV